MVPVVASASLSNVFGASPWKKSINLKGRAGAPAQQLCVLWVSFQSYSQLLANTMMWFSGDPAACEMLGATVVEEHDWLCNTQRPAARGPGLEDIQGMKEHSSLT